MFRDDIHREARRRRAISETRGRECGAVYHTVGNNRYMRRRRNRGGPIECYCHGFRVT